MIWVGGKGAVPSLETMNISSSFSNAFSKLVQHFMNTVNAITQYEGFPNYRYHFHLIKFELA